MAGRLKYHFEDDQKLIHFLLEELKDDNFDAKYPLGNNIWRLAAEREITRHTFQSMLGRFKKFLLPQLKRHSAFVEDNDRLYMMDKWGYEVSRSVPRKQRSKAPVRQLSSDDEDHDFLNAESDTPSIDSVNIETYEDAEGSSEDQPTSTHETTEEDQMSADMSENLLTVDGEVNSENRQQLADTTVVYERKRQKRPQQSVAGYIVTEVDNGEPVVVEEIPRLTSPADVEEDLYKELNVAETYRTKALLFDWLQSGVLKLSDCNTYLKLFNEICRVAKLHNVSPLSVADQLSEVGGDFQKLQFNVEESV